MGKKLREQIDYVYARLQAVYAALGNIAFWDGKPASATILPNLDWGLPKHTLTLNLTLSNASVKVNGTAYTNGDTLSVEEYATLSVLIEPSADHLFNTAPTLSFGGQSVTLTANQDGSYSADVVMGQSDATLAVAATGVASYLISYGTMTNCSVVTSPAPTSILGGTGVVEIEFSVDSGYMLNASCFTVTNASKAWDASTNKLTISNATGNVTISATATETGLLFLKGYYIKENGELSNTAITKTTDGVTDNLTDKIILSDYVHIQQASSVSNVSACRYMYNLSGYAYSVYPSAISFFVKENGAYRLILTQRVSSSKTSQSIAADTLQANTELMTALADGNLYARFSARSDNGTTVYNGGSGSTTCYFTFDGTYYFATGSTAELGKSTIVTDPSLFAPYTNS